MLDYLEAVSLPNGLCCLKCGIMEAISKSLPTRPRGRARTGRARLDGCRPLRRLYQCKDCGYQFSATNGTVFHDSHLSLVKWFMAVGLIVERKREISALQVARHLNFGKTSYKNGLVSLPSNPQGYERRRAY